MRTSSCLPTRREFLTTASAAVVAARHRAGSRTILVCSGWQTVNIGDIAHTPGLLAVLERELPDARIILWPRSSLDRGVQAMLRKRFTRLRILREMARTQDKPRDDDPTLAEAIAEATIFLHGSGPSLVAQVNVEQWRKQTRKPWGAWGVTLDPSTSRASRELLDSAAFLFTRETRSRDELKKANCQAADIAFVPDATLAVDLRNDTAAKATIRRHNLEPGRFLCVVPRLRYTPYWEIHNQPTDNPETQRKITVNKQHADSDHAKLRAGLVAWVRQTGQRVLLCPEMTYQADLLRPLLFDPLPDDVKTHVASLDRYWLTDEAASVYALSRAVLSCECHSPLLAIAAGRPALYVRQPTDTWKGQMYPDLGLGDWAPEIDQVTGEEIARRLLAIERDETAAVLQVQQAQARAGERFRHAADRLRALLA